VANSGDQLVERSFHLGPAEIILSEMVSLNLEARQYDAIEASN